MIGESVRFWKNALPCPYVMFREVGNSIALKMVPLVMYALQCVKKLMDVASLPELAGAPSHGAPTPGPVAQAGGPSTSAPAPTIAA
eukprot:12838-Pelagomonas_calceolata.AAC.1